MARIRLDMISTAGLSRSFLVGEGGCVIGRSVRARIRVALPSISPRHALVEFVDGCFLVRPCDPGTSDVFLNDEVVPHCGRVIEVADVLRIGMTSFKVCRSSDAIEKSTIEVKRTGILDVGTEAALQADAGPSSEEVAAAPGD